MKQCVNAQQAEVINVLIGFMQHITNAEEKAVSSQLIGRSK